MTTQIAERVRYKGEDEAMCTTPLSEYFEKNGIRPKFELVSSDLWRGYIGNWEIVDDRLYLIGLEGTLIDGTEASLATIFPEFPDRVFAHWYSGTIRIPQGKELEYVLTDYSRKFERDLFLDVENGVVMATRERHNGAAESETAQISTKSAP